MYTFQLAWVAPALAGQRSTSNGVLLLLVVAGAGHTRASASENDSPADGHGIHWEPGGLINTWVAGKVLSGGLAES
jgi:hypothetical protein